MKCAVAMSYRVLLDTSFIIRLLDPSHPVLHANAMSYWEYFLNQGIPMYYSTISVAEYAVRGEVRDLPIKNMRLLPFNLDHADVAGSFAAHLFKARNAGKLPNEARTCVPNDAKLFAQGHLMDGIRFFVTSDSKPKAAIDELRSAQSLSLEHLDIHTPYNEAFGILDFD